MKGNEKRTFCNTVHFPLGFLLSHTTSLLLSFILSAIFHINIYIKLRAPVPSTVIEWKWEKKNLLTILLIIMGIWIEHGINFIGVWKILKTKSSIIFYVFVHFTQCSFHAEEEKKRRSSNANEMIAHRLKWNINIYI